MATSEASIDPLLRIVVELTAFDRTTDWFARALHLNYALLHAVGQRYLSQEIRERLSDAERRFLAELPSTLPTVHGGTTSGTRS